jgi:hypothetical protein
MSVITESIDDLVRECEVLKNRLEEERAKFNDVECKCKIIVSFSSFVHQLIDYFLISNNCSG